MKPIFVVVEVLDWVVNADNKDDQGRAAYQVEGSF